MPEKGTDPQRLTSDSLLDLLLDALQERQAERRGGAGARAEKKAPVDRAAEPSQTADEERATRSKQKQADERPETRPGEAGWLPPARVPSMHLEKVLARFLALVAVLIVAVNIPVNAYGVSLARILPDSASLVIREGLVLKGSGSEIYILQDDKLRWISSMDAFEHLGLNWGDVHVVEDGFLQGFEQGRPVHVLLKCADSLHIYRLEDQEKRWIRDIDAFVSEGHVWDDVRFVSCQYLRGLPDGLPIPEDAGPPPKP